MTTAISRRRRVRFPVAEFVAQYHDAVRAGLTMQEFADLIGVTYKTVSMRLHALKVRGIVLPKLKHALAGKPSNNPAGPKGKRSVSKLVAPIKGELVPASRTVIVPPGQKVAIENNSTANLPITITIGG